MYQCPHCENEIENLDFQASTSGWESGSAILSEENEEHSYDRVVDHDYGDGETTDTGDYEYTCPECDHSINLRDLIWVGNEEDEKDEKIYEHQKCYTCIIKKQDCYHKNRHCKHCLNNKEPEPEETLHKIISPNKNIMSEREPEDTTEEAIICKNKKCKYVFVYETNNNDDKDEFYECPKCQTINSKKDYWKTLDKQNDRKKTTN